MDIREAVAGVPIGVPLAVALSGGLDSTVLLHAVATLVVPDRLRGIHINHGLQPEACTWERHCGAFAATLGVPFHALRRPPRPGNVEAGARRARYGVWRTALAAGEVLLLAHHADDQAETVLWQAATGRAPIGMPRERPLGAGRLCRPFLGVRREALGEYAAEHRLHWVEDPSNADLAYDRNYIRHQILPRLEARFPGAAARLAARAGDWVVRPAGAPVAVAGLGKAALRDWLGAAVSDRGIEEMLRQARARPGASPAIRLRDGRTVRRHGGFLHLVEPDASAREQDPPLQVRAGCAATFGQGTLAWRRAGRGLPDATTWTVGYRRGGECIAPAGRGVTKTLKALFQEAGVPPWRRSAWPLLFEGDALVAVPGIAVSGTRAVDGGWWPCWQPAPGGGPG